MCSTGNNIWLGCASHRPIERELQPHVHPVIHQNHRETEMGKNKGRVFCSSSPRDGANVSSSSSSSSPARRQADAIELFPICRLLKSMPRQNVDRGGLFTDREPISRARSTPNMRSALRVISVGRRQRKRELAVDYVSGEVDGLHSAPQSITFLSTLRYTLLFGRTNVSFTFHEKTHIGD